MAKEKSNTYRSYLLRCWQEKPAGLEQPSLWRFMLQDVADAQRQHAFSNFEQLVAFLRTEILGKKD